jgi:pyrroloquinoline-quinone synthase
MQLFAEIDAARKRWDVLAHPFYTRWSEGALSRDELALYAGQYRHAVVALADASSAAARSADAGDARETLEAHAAEEREHVALWDRFASAFGADGAAGPTPETERCVEAWAGDRDRALPASLVVLYAIESSQPRISEVKRAGLVEHYGCERSSEATVYFDLHAVRDHDHAAQHRAMISAVATGGENGGLAEHAERALAANWLLLDGVERLSRDRAGTA